MVFYALGVVDGSARIEGSLGLVCMSDLANTPREYLNVYLHEKLAFFEVVSCTRGGIVPKKCVKYGVKEEQKTKKKTRTEKAIYKTVEISTV